MRWMMWRVGSRGHLGAFVREFVRVVKHSHRVGDLVANEVEIN